jgi:hypothetical protein
MKIVIRVDISLDESKIELGGEKLYEQFQMDLYELLDQYGSSNELTLEMQA